MIVTTLHHIILYQHRTCFAMVMFSTGFVPNASWAGTCGKRPMHKKMIAIRTDNIIKYLPQMAAFVQKQSALKQSKTAQLLLYQSQFCFIIV